MIKSRNGLSWEEASQLAVKVNQKNKTKRIEGYNLNPSICKFCGSLLSYEKRKNKFCSHSCSASFNNQGVPRNVSNGLWKIKQCIFCGKETSNIKYCNNKCYSLHMKAERRKKIQESDSIFDKKDKWYLIEIRGHQCETCNNQKWNKQNIPLDIHHKDGDTDNNTLNNLQLICPNCHRLTPNHGSKNNTNSKKKKYRKKRYDKGLSY